MSRIGLFGVPLDCGKRRQGCRMGPDALRVAGLHQALSSLGHDVTDLGDLEPASVLSDSAPAIEHCISWTQSLLAVDSSLDDDTVPIFMGGDHAMVFGTLPLATQKAKRKGRPIFLLWLDAHSDFHTPQTTQSGNLHGCPVAYASGQSGFFGFPKVEYPMPMQHICMMGLRSVDPAERRALEEAQARLFDMRAIDEHGFRRPLDAFLSDVEKAGGDLHVSLDVDFLDPSIAPGVGTTVPGGATEREAHLIMELLFDRGLVTSLDIAELNPFLDERGRTATLMVDLVASLFGRRIFDRPTRGF